MLCNAAAFAELRKQPTSGRMIVCVFVLNRSANGFRLICRANECSVEIAVDTFPAGCVASVIGLEAIVVVGQEDIGSESGLVAAALNT